MLVLSRKENERLRVGDSIVLTIVEVNGERVKVGIEAPKDVAIVRDEIRESEMDITAEESSIPMIEFVEIPLKKKAA